MKPVFLIAVNFVREQRWPMFVLLLLVLLLAFFGLVVNIREGREDLLWIFKQIAGYVVAFSGFFGGSAIYNERKTRRILAVLSKGISRGEYLSGLVLGVTISAGIYCLALGLTGTWTLGAAGFPMSQVWFLMLCLMAGSILAGTVALLFSTFLNPFLAATATSGVLVSTFVAGHLLGRQWAYVFPSYTLAAYVMNSSFALPGHPDWRLIACTLAEGGLFWFIGMQIFTYVDIAVAMD